MCRGPRRGLALIVVLTVLALLLLLSVSFSTISALENHVSRAYSDEVLARLVAKAGMEQGYARLRELIEMELAGRTTGTISPLQALRYYGSDLAEKGDNPALLNTPLELALNPSLAVEAGGGGGLELPQNPLDENTRPAGVRIDGQTRGFSGYLSSSRYGLRSDIFSLRITDMSGMIYVNDGVGENPRYGSVSANLKRILNQLGKVVQVTGLGDRIVNRRPPKGYADKPALEAVLGHDDYVKASPFLTAHAWVDRSVVQPVPLSSSPQVLQAYRDALGFSNDASAGPYYRGRPAVFRYGRGRNRDGNLVPGLLKFAPEAADPQGYDHAIWGVDELNPQWIEVCARAPVNLNAAPREVLMALLADLQGFWMAGRRMNNPNCSDPANNTRLWNNNIVQSLDSGGAGMTGGDGDAMGFLYSTDKITWSPGNTSDSVNSATAIADELIACREGLVSKVSQFDYNRKKNPEAWFAGPFRTWRQFYAFCDHLVKLGLIRESRSIYAYHPPPGSGFAGGGQPAPVGTADALMAMASQAIADVIKANFNPNCHLNEANPDENMALLVDKTDLIVMSTEGAFLPGGYFEIESLGRVLRPLHLESRETRTHGINDAMNARDNAMVAEAALTGIVKLYDARRFTSQKDFYPGEITKRQTLPETNNGLSVEIGPEPDCGSAPREAEWDGYLALPTNGGQPWASSPGGPEIPLPKPPDVLGFTPKSDASEIEPTTNTLHAHFTYDTRLHSQSDGIPANLAPVAMTNENVENRPDRTEQLAGPYDPAMGVDPGSGRGGNRHRLARSFRLPDADSTARPPDTFPEAAPLDLRIDGAYLERDANLAYWMTPDSLGGHKFMIKFVTSFWMKPNFHPESTGKPRLLWNGGRAELRKNLWNFYGYPVEPGMLDLYLTASQDPETEPTFFTGSFTNWSPCRPASLLFMHSASYMTDPLNFPTSLCYALCVATQTKTLNHHHHHPDKGWSNQHPPAVIERGTPGYERDNPLAAHRWMHVVVACKTNWASPTPDARIWVNGKSTVQMPNSPRWGVYPLGLPTSYRIDWTQNFHDDNTFNAFPYADKNLMKFGQTHRVTTLVHADNSPYTTRHNFACDSTIDEFSHFAGWDEITEGAALAQWRRGRYHSPRMKDEGRYTSEPFSLLTQSSRRLPPASGGGASTGTTTRAEQAAQQPIQVLGVAWTVFGETLDREDPELAPQMIDYNTVDSPEPDLLKVKTELSLEADQLWSAPVTRDAFSMLEDAQTGARLVLKDATKVRFRVRFAWDKPAPVTTILHATPYVDDVTIYFDAGDSGFISFQTK